MRIEGAEIERASVARRARCLLARHEVVDRAQKIEAREVRDALIAHIEDIGRLARGHHGLELGVEAASVARVQPLHAHTWVRGLEGAQRILDDLVLFLPAFARPVHYREDDLARFRVGARNGSIGHPRERREDKRRCNCNKRRANGETECPRRA